MNIQKFFIIFVVVVIIFTTTTNCTTYILDDAYDEPQHQMYRMKPKRAINPFMDSIGKRNDFFPGQPRRYFDVLAGQSLGKRSNYDKK